MFRPFDEEPTQFKSIELQENDASLDGAQLPAPLKDDAPPRPSINFFNSIRLKAPFMYTAAKCWIAFLVFWFAMFGIGTYYLNAGSKFEIPGFVFLIVGFGCFFSAALGVIYTLIGLWQAIAQCIGPPSS